MGKQIIKEFAKDNFIKGTEGYELVIMLLALVKQGKIEDSDILDILNYVFDNNTEGVLNSLIKAKQIVNDDLISSILKEV